MTSWRPLRVPAGLAGSGAPLFVGRFVELADLERIWSSVVDESRQVAFIGGEPGVGKSRLVTEAATSLQAQGAAVLWGTCHADLDVPYRPFVAALDALFQQSEPGALAPVLGETANHLLRLTPKVRRHRPDLHATTPEHQDRRFELFDAVLDLLLALAERQPVVLVLEDLHWASGPTLQLLRHLVQSTARTRLLLLVTHRTTAPDRSEQLTYTIADLYRHDGVARIDLDGLETEDIADYLVRSTGMSPASARSSAALLRDQTAGNPFFLHELWRDISMRGGVEVLRAAGFRAPTSVRDTLERRLADLTPEQEDVLALAAVMGDTFNLTVLLDAAEHAGDVILDTVDLGVRFGLFGAAAGGRHRFVHALARQAVLDRLPTARAIEMHARVASCLEKGNTDDPAVVARLAYHYERAHAIGYARQAVTYLVAAARHARRSLAYEEAAELYLRAAAVTTADGPQLSELRLEAARNQMAAGAFAEARGIYEELAKTDDPHLLRRAAIGYEDAAWRPGTHGEQALDLLEEALRRDDDGSGAMHPDRVRALASLGRARSFNGDARGARAAGEQALELARGSDDDDLLAHALATTLWRGMTPSLAPVLLARATELAELGRRLGNDEHLGAAGFYRAVFGYMQGDRDQWERARDDLLRAARAGGQPFFHYVAGCETYARQYATGDFEGAGRTVATLAELGTEFGTDTTEGSHGIQVFMLRRATGSLEEIRPLITGAEDLTTHWPPGLLALYCELGLWPSAARVLHHVLERLDAYRSTSATWAGVLAFTVDAAVRIGDEQAAQRLRPHLAAYQGRNLIAGQFVAVFGSADRYLARIDSLLGADSVEVHLEAALDMDRRMGALTHQVETLVAWSQHVVRGGGTVAGRRGDQLRSEARAIAERIGYRRALRYLGVEKARQPEVARPDGLTRREIEVLTLVADGLSNREIGEQLFISQNTAANHVRSILMKTGAPNRTRAAIYAAEHDLLGARPG